MESKKANLIIDITKNIVEQYRDQLKVLVEQVKITAKLNDKHPYFKKDVIRVESCLELINDILDNFDKSIFDGEITDNKTLQAIYDKDGKHMEEIKYDDNTISKEKREIDRAMHGAERVIKQLGIPEYTMYPVTYHIMQLFEDKNYLHNEGKKELYLRSVKGINPKFNPDGKYKVDILSVNDLLHQVVTFDTKVLIETNEEPILYYPEYAKTPFIIDANPIYDIVNDYVKNYIDENYPETLEGKNQNEILDEQNNFLNDTFDTIKNISGGIGINNNEYEDSSYYYENFKRLEPHYPYNNKYFETPRKGKLKRELTINEKVEKIKGLLQKLENLTVQEQKLTSELNTISERKQSIVDEINGFKL